MNVRDEIKKYAKESDKSILLWLFERYHFESQWKFVAYCTSRRYGPHSYQINRVWHPTEEGQALYCYMTNRNAHIVALEQRVVELEAAMAAMEKDDE